MDLVINMYECILNYIYHPFLRTTNIMEEKTFKNDTDVSMVLNLQEESLSHEKVCF